MDKLKENQISIEIPEDIVKTMEKIRGEKGEWVREFVRVAFRLEEAKEKVTTTYSKIGEKEKQYSQKLKFAFDKLKLKKKTQYSWRFDNGNRFVGTKVEKKVEVKVEEKKEEKK